jgi:hypothetical protein
MPDESSTASAAGLPAIWTLELSLETDDADLIERIQDEIRLLACPDANRTASADHSCPVPWYLITTYLEAGSQDAESYRDLLNR